MKGILFHSDLELESWLGLQHNPPESPTTDPQLPNKTHVPTESTATNPMRGITYQNRLEVDSWLDPNSVTMDPSPVAENLPPIFVAAACYTPVTPHVHPSAAAPSDGLIHPSRKIYRPPLASEYVEPDPCPDLLDGMEIIFQRFGRSLRRHVQELAPRTDVIEFDAALHQQELERNIKWRDCPDDIRPLVLAVIHEYWDVFCEEGLRKNIRGFSFRVDTGDCKPVCCRPPRYGPSETKVMTDLVNQLEENGLVTDDTGAWGAQIVLAAKANQQNVKWDAYQWRLCVSYRRLNQVTKPFTFPIPRCDDAVADIGPDARYMLSMDMDAGYWQVGVDEQASREKLAFFTPQGKKHWTVMPMGSLNAHAVFVAMMTKLQAKWTTNADIAKLPRTGSKVIVDDILLYAYTVGALFSLWKMVLNVLQHHSATIKLKKCKFFDRQCEFVGVDIGQDGNSPATSKYEAFMKLPRPETWADLRMIIGMFGFYATWIQNYEVRIKPWRNLQKRAPNPGSIPVSEERKLMTALWTSAHSDLLEALKSEIISGPVLARPDPERRFYVKTDWSKDGIGAVLLQADDTDKSREAEATEASGGPCLFDRTKKGLRLRPIAFLSRSTTAREQSYHSYIGEACAGRWTFGKWKKYLIGREFTWLSDCSGLKRFHEECDGIPTHQAQRWRAELSLFQKTLEHRPAEMMTDCDVLSRYNATTEGWREAAAATPLVATTSLSVPPALFSTQALSETCNSAFTFLTSPDVRGAVSWKASSPLVNAHDHRRNIFAVGSVAVPVEEACSAAGVHGSITPTEDSNFPIQQELRGAEEYHSFQEQSAETRDYPAPDFAPHDWLVATYTGQRTPDGIKDVELTDWLTRVDVVARAKIARHHLRAAIFIVPIRFPNALTHLQNPSNKPPPSWSYTTVELRNTHHGGHIETDHYALCLVPTPVSTYVFLQQDPEPAADMECFLDGPEAGCEDALWLDNFEINKNYPIRRNATEHPYSAKVARYVKYCADTQPLDGYPAYDPSGPGPSIADPLSRVNGQFFDGAFGLWLHEKGQTTGPACRAIRAQELMRLFGLSDERAAALMRARDDAVVNRLRPLPGKHGLAALFATIHHAETCAALSADTHLSPSATSTLPDQGFVTPASLANVYAYVMDDATTLPLPTTDEWKTATAEDPDLQQVILALRNRVPVRLAALSEKAYATAMASNLLELDDDLIYYYEHSKSSRVRQLRAKVVPPKLRRVALAACHVSPFAGHSGVDKTVYRLRARFWWPGMIRDAHDGVRGCAHCNLANNASHEARMLLHTLSCDGPFDTMFIDLWSPGDIPSKDGHTKVITCLDGMTGFANACFIGGVITADKVATLVFTHFFVPFGLPRLIFVDKDGLFASVFQELFRLLKVPIHVAAPGNHKAIRCERFHRYLNKVETINTADKKDLTLWKQGVLFACYAWNASPIDGTDIPRSVVAIGRDFPFPIDLSPAMARGVVREGQQALDYCDAASPLLYKQRQILKLVNEERRLRHAELRNDGIKERCFEVGDLVIIRKQVKSNAALGVSAKLVFKAKGPYRVLGPATNGTYSVQRLPFLRGMRRKGTIRKESAARMERIPSTLILHKRADGADSRFSDMHARMSKAPLEQWLGVLRHGAYHKAPNDADWAFDRLDSMWSDTVDDDSSDSDYVPSGGDEDEDELRMDDDVPSAGGAQAISENDPAPCPHVQTAPQQHQQRATTTSTPEPPIITNVPLRALRKFRKHVDDSLDRLFFVRWQPPDAVTPNWRLAQVDLEWSDPTMCVQYGKYAVKWWTPRTSDRSTRAYPNCRFMPDIRFVRADGDIGGIYEIRPEKVAIVLDRDNTLLWMKDTIMLVEDKILGPFNFSQIRESMQGPRNKSVSEDFRIDSLYWDSLEQTGPTFGVDMSDLRAPPPRRRWGPSRPDAAKRFRPNTSPAPVVVATTNNTSPR